MPAQKPKPIGRAGRDQEADELEGEEHVEQVGVEQQRRRRQRFQLHPHARRAPRHRHSNQRRRRRHVEREELPG